LDSKTPRAAALVLSLILVASLLGTLSGGLAAPLSQLAQRLHPSSSPEAVVTASGADTGILLLRVSQELTGVNPIPIENATARIQRQVFGSYPLQVTTNSSGEAEWQLTTGNYSVSVSDALFRASADVQIRPNQTTLDDVTLTKVSDPILFADLSDGDSSGSVAPWQSIQAAVNGTTAIAPRGIYFVDALYGQSPVQSQAGQGSTAPFAQEDVAAVSIQSTAVTGTGGTSLLWLTLRPQTFFPVEGATSLSLVTFSAVTRISYHG
jgi:hypothetical protein